MSSYFGRRFDGCPKCGVDMVMHMGVDCDQGANMHMEVECGEDQLLNMGADIGQSVRKYYVKKTGSSMPQTVHGTLFLTTYPGDGSPPVVREVTVNSSFTGPNYDFTPDCVALRCRVCPAPKNDVQEGLMRHDPSAPQTRKSTDLMSPGDSGIYDMSYGSPAGEGAGVTPYSGYTPGRRSAEMFLKKRSRLERTLAPLRSSSTPTDEVRGVVERVEQPAPETTRSHYQLGSTPRSHYVPGSPPRSSYLPVSTPKSSYAPASPPRSSYVPVSPLRSSYVPASPPSSRYVPASPMQVSQFRPDMFQMLAMQRAHQHMMGFTAPVVNTPLTHSQRSMEENMDLILSPPHSYTQQVQGVILPGDTAASGKHLGESHEESSYPGTQPQVLGRIVATAPGIIDMVSSPEEVSRSSRDSPISSVQSHLEINDSAVVESGPKARGRAPRTAQSRAKKYEGKKNPANGERKVYSCEHCNKTFLFKSKYLEHRPVHSYQRPHTCPFPLCTRTYKYPYDLRVHIKAHLGVPTKTKICHICRKAFGHNKMVREHTRNAHPKEHHEIEAKVNLFMSQAKPVPDHGDPEELEIAASAVEIKQEPV